MEFKVTARLLTAESKPYEMNGNSGVSHRVRFNIEGEIFNIKSSAEVVRSLSSRVGEEGRLTFKLESRKENLSMSLVSFE